MNFPYKILIMGMLLLCSCEDFFLSDVDECGVIDGDNTSCSDCAGVPNGSSQLDDCGICNGDNLSCSDCTGVPNGLALEDNCGVCDSNPENDCIADCAGQWGGIAVEDDCGICNNYIINNGVQPNFPYGICDCNGDVNGTAYIDGCETCVEGTTGNSACLIDCNGVENGNDMLDNCGVCDSDPENDCIADCAGKWGGTATEDECGVCAGDSSTCLDCFGVPNGSAELDACGICDGDNLSCTGCMISGSDNYSANNIIPDNESCFIDYNLSIQTILSNNCTGCHNSTSDGLNLTSYSNLINSNIIQNGDSTNSILWQVIAGENPLMPPAPLELSDYEIHKIAYKKCSQARYPTYYSIWR